MDAKKRLSELDLLRFLAAVAVVVYHRFSLDVVGWPLYNIAQFGYLGVELFFMISGFVILWTASNRTWREFLASRISRLYPSFLVALVLTSLALSLRDQGPTPVQFAANVTMLPGFFNQPAVDVVYWTLALEIKFYALIFALLLFKQFGHIERYLWGWLAICLASHFIPTGPLTLLGYAPLFVAGCVFYLIRSQGVNASRLGLLFGSIALSVWETAILAPGFANRSSYVGMSPLIAVEIFTVLALLFYAIATDHLRLPQWKGWAILGAMTYPLYLLHDKIGETVWELTPGDLWVKQVLALAIPLALALAFAVTVEKYGVKGFNRTLLQLWNRPVPA
jgi:peptidoglycan/LPS O-acetylase OafA/YrhL